MLFFKLYIKVNEIGGTFNKIVKKSCYTNMCIYMHAHISWLLTS